jgi:hypothetical protein
MADAGAGACAPAKVAAAIPAANIKEWIVFNFIDKSPIFVFIAFVSYSLLLSRVILKHFYFLYLTNLKAHTYCTAPNI